ncbi:thiamine-phosphate kinase [Millisia brevis]|uniref:thiamine-phosphate kinase n=1 Tax=Millisia brevis TaxID=264148 RepID=UPI00082C8469|nr:thiamine-phosphate kinase [Millisia brevis]
MLEGDCADPAADPGAASVSELGEFGLIDRLVRGRRMPPASVPVGPGDDGAVLAVPDGRVVVSTDMLMQDKHFRLDWSTPYDIGVKAIAQNGADIAAMGGRCVGFVVALGLPPDTAVSMVERLYDGLWAEADRAGGAIVGGDVVAAPTVVISVTVLGSLEGRSPIRRSGARPGDVVAINGETGWSAAGLTLLERGLPTLPGDGPGLAVDRHRQPRPDYDSAVAAALGGATAMIDTSDGLLADLGHIAEESGVHIDLAADRLRAPAQLAAVAQNLGVDPTSWVVGGGEDHALVATFPTADAVPASWRRIGRVVAAGDPAAVTIDGKRSTDDAGWTSFPGTDRT